MTKTYAQALKDLIGFIEEYTIERIDEAGGDEIEWDMVGAYWEQIKNLQRVIEGPKEPAKK